ncbi:MAG TPA: hypothetical protein DHU96_03625 [Actinobacteria bacterium]|nr:hypothetical protein [Actinomycetota bacterium]
MGAVLDERLVGYWSDQDLYRGAMEAADIAFRPDGTGWTYWSRDAGTFFAYRFTWHTTEGHRLALALHHELSGTWDLKDHTTPPRHQPRRLRPGDRRDLPDPYRTRRPRKTSHTARNQPAD